MNPYQFASSLLPGLPATRLPAAARRSGATRSARLGATVTDLQRPLGAIPVAGQPSLTLQRRGAGVSAVLLRRIPYADLLTDADLLPLKRLLRRAESRAERLSHGTLSRRELASRGHPYGRGGRRGGLGRLQGSRVGVSNLAVVNRQSGRLSRSWGHHLTRAKDGVRLELFNRTRQAWLTTRGTPRMRAHGPISAVMVQGLPAINQEVMRLARVAKARAQASGVAR